MTEETEEFTMDFFKEDESSDENTIDETPAKNEVEETAEPKAEAEAKDETNEEVKADEEVPKEPELDAYEPNLKYKVKDEEKEFPEIFKAMLTSKENEDMLRDLFTKADALEAVKGSRTAIETELNNFRQDYQNQVVPVLSKIGDFDNAVRVGDFNKAFELADINPESVVDSLLLDEKHSNMIMTKLHKMLEGEANGGNNLESQRMAHNEKINASKLELENEALRQQLQSNEQRVFDEMLQFSISQQNAVASQYDAVQGQGKFEEMVRNLGHLEYMKGNKLTAAQAVDYTIKALNLGGATSNVNNTEEAAQAQVLQQQAQSQATKPNTIPNIGTGSNVSVVKQHASTWDDWNKQVQAG